MSASNLAERLLRTAAERPDLRIEVGESSTTLAGAIDAAQQISAILTDLGLRPGSTLVLIGTNSLEYTVFWFATQLAGLQTVVMNPEYPADLMADLIGEVRAGAVASDKGWVTPGDGYRIDYADVLSGAMTVDGVPHAGDLRSAAGTDRDPLDIATLMYTSGTSGRPKLCAQSHRYLLELGQYVADTFCLSPADVVYAPLPLFHINPLGYGLMGALCGLSDFVTSPRFSASRFWPTVTDHRVTVLILHGPPVQILLKNPRPSGAHAVRAAFFANEEFLRRYRIPVGVTGYGSTEFGGLTHTRLWRHGERVDIAEGMTALAGRARPGVEWRLGSDGEIELRAQRDGLFLSGYLRAGVVDPTPSDDNGWIRTGDRGRAEGDELVFIERMGESVRMRGEYVPLSYLDGVFAELEGVQEASTWTTQDTAELAVYVVGDPDLSAVSGLIEGLPKFMRPTWMIQTDALPRDLGVGKVQRRRLAEVEELTRRLLV
ncbi:AMP-binding protein [Williamsia sp. DF01-3]|uniref:AMP-binding protein n=1 Tax=Williamsia sp. DF01-3 TaxID=2934157 RepID=UPI001FF16E35|nr:AMP-binding protein [Williamsia sp. DF01-3]MCK0516728.1 AMP-binding protein [Williamsia sp. DF01-3]